MLFKTCSILALLVAGAGSAHAETKRQHDAHQHGHGALNIAVEGNTLTMELEVPGADITGFEHAASSKEDKAAVAGAKKTLASPKSLFTLSNAAGCTLTEAKVALSNEEHEHGHEHGHEHKHDEKKHAHGHHGSHDAKKDEAAEHAEFHVEYAFNCTNTGALDSIEFPYFKQFPNAEELDVTLITPKGQKKFEVNRQQNRIDLPGMM